MPNRVSIHGRPDEPGTKAICRELNSMSVEFDLYDVASDGEFPKVEIACREQSGLLVLTNPDRETLRQTLYAQDVLGVTSYWV